MIRGLGVSKCKSRAAREIVNCHPMALKCAAILLAGGGGRRFGGRDKGLLPWRDSTLVSAAAKRLALQADSLVISCNRNLAEYRALGYPVVQDAEEGFQGPLAGVLAALPLCAEPLALVCPVDCPLLPADILDTLRNAMQAKNTEVAVPHDGERLQHRVFLIRTEAGASLAEFFQTGGRSVHGWMADRQVAEVDFSSRPECLANANTPEELARLEAMVQLP